MSIQPPERRLVTEATLPDRVDQALTDPDSPAHASLLGTIAARRTLAFDTFQNLPSGPPPTVTASGQPWGYHLGEQLEVRDGMLGLKPEFGSAYAELEMDSPITRIGCEFMFDDEGGTLTAQASMALNTWNDGGIAANGTGRRTRAHVGILPTGIEYGIRTETPGSAATITDLHSHIFATPLPMNTPLVFEYYLDGDTATIIPPNGEAYTVTDPRIATLDDHFACWQPFRQGADSSRIKPRILRVWADAGPDTLDRGDRLSVATAQRVARLAPTVPTVVTAWERPATALTLTETMQNIPNLELSCKAGPAGQIIWDITVPIAQTTGDGNVGGGSAMVGIATTAGVTAYTQRATWQQTNAAVQVRIIEGGLVPGRMYTRRAQARKDAGGTGTSTLPALRDRIFTGTPA